LTADQVQRVRRLRPPLHYVRRQNI
jgi:hypothetical protein